MLSFQLITHFKSPKYSSTDVAEKLLDLDVEQLSSPLIDMTGVKEYKTGKKSRRLELNSEEKELDMLLKDSNLAKVLCY